MQISTMIPLSIKRLTAIWDTQTQNQNARDPAYSRGTGVMWKEE